MRLNIVRFTILALVLAVWISIQTWAATINAASCEQKDVQAAIDQAQDGDTILVPPGTATWSTPVDITKPLVIIGAGSSNTVLIANGTMDKGYFYTHGLVSSALMRISGFFFEMNDSVPYTAIWIESANDVRIDHNTFNKGKHHIVPYCAKGVIDHNRFYNSRISIDYSGGWNKEMADVSWKSMDAGTGDAMFIEDNIWIDDGDFPHGQLYSEKVGTGSGGGKLVIRNNHFDGKNFKWGDALTFSPIMTHGNTYPYWQQPNNNWKRGQSIVEIYNNLMEAKRVSFPVICRGSSNLIYNNSVIQTTYTGVPRIELQEEESWSTSWIPLRVEWPGEDQVHNTFIWNNTYNTGSWPKASNVLCTKPDFIQENRDFFLHEPKSTGGREYFTGKNGASGSYPTDGIYYPTLGTMVFEPTGANAHYPYVPYLYPHPLTGAPMLNLSSAINASQVTLTWNAITGAINYKISRNWQDIATVAGTNYSEAKPSIESGYVVTALDASGKILAAEGVKVGTPLDTTAPTAPGTPASSSVTQTAATLNWTASTDNVGVTGYRIYRNGIQIGTSVSTTFTDSELTANTTYSYAVSAYDGSGNESAQSEPVSVTTSGGGNGSGGGDVGGGGGGGGGCFITAARSASPWLPVLAAVAAGLGWIKRAKNKKTGIIDNETIIKKQYILER